MSLINEVLSDKNLQAAYQWLCERRLQHAPNAGVWDFRWHWPEYKERFIQGVLAGTYHFKPLQEIRLPEEIRYGWAPEDALLLKALANVLKKHLPLPDCGHLAGQGLKKTVNTVEKNKSEHTFFIRTDVKGYYANMDKRQTPYATF